MMMTYSIEPIKHDAGMDKTVWILSKYSLETTLNMFRKIVFKLMTVKTAKI